MRVTTRLIICTGLVGCASLPTAPSAMGMKPCAAEKPTIDIVHVDGHFVISDGDMGKLTGYMAALEAGCVAPN